MKRYWLIMLAVLLLALPQMAAAEHGENSNQQYEVKALFPDREITDPMKPWKISFSKGVDVKTVNAQSVYILNATGEKITTDIQISADGRQVTVTPRQPYTAGSTYKLVALDTVMSSNGKKLKENAEQTFILKGRETLPQGWDPGLTFTEKHRTDTRLSLDIQWNPQKDPSVAGYTLYFRTRGESDFVSVKPLGQQFLTEPFAEVTIQNNQITGKLYDFYVTVRYKDGTESLPSQLESLIYNAGQGDSVENRKKEIQQQWDLLKPRYQGPLLSSQPSVTPPYRLGSVADGALKDALNLTNFIRYAAYLPSDVKLNDSFNKSAQAASLVNAVNQQITHYPAKPSGMDENLFRLGYEGAGTSNIGLGYHNILSSIQKGYMSDADNSNRDRIGHRRWILSPKLKQVGFGYAMASNNRGHTAMKVIEDNMWRNPSPSYEYIAWPSKGAFPINFLDARDPWSVSLNEEIYDASKLKDIQVTLTRSSSQQKWTFGKGNVSNGYFNIDTAGYGYTPYTIIFQPYDVEAFQEDEKFTVEITGLFKKSGESTTVHFETTFFQLN